MTRSSRAQPPPVPGRGLRSGLDARLALRRWDPGSITFGVVVLVHFAVLAPRLIVPDLVLHYPFLGGDSHDWIATGLAQAGEDVRSTSRPPLLPWIVAGLSRVSALHLLPVLIQALVHLTSLGLYHLLRRDYPSPLAWAVAAAWLVNGSWLRLSLDVMADVPAACLLAWAIIFWRRTSGDRPGYVLAGLAAGASAITQQLALLFPAAVLATVALFRRRDLTSRAFLLGATCFVTPAAIGFLLKWRAMRLAGDDLSHFSLLRFHTDSIAHYLFQYVAFLGWPAAVGVGAGLLSFVARARHDSWCFFVLAVQSLCAGFFVFLYDFNSLRFLAYVFPLSAVLLAEGLSRLRRPAWAAGLALASALWALPLPNERADRTHIVLWPAPPIYLKADSIGQASGWRRLDLSELAIERHPISNLARHNLYSRVAQRRSDVFEPRPLQPQSFRNDLWALYFYAPPETADGYREVTLELGNLLLRRVHYLPWWSLEPIRPSLHLTRLAELDGKALYRARLSGRPESWIVAVRAGGEADARLSAATSPSPTRLASELARADRVTRAIDRRPTAILGPTPSLPPWQAYLPFLVDTSLFFVVEPDREAAARDLLGDAGPDILVDGVRIAEYEIFGRPWKVIDRRQP